MTDREG